MRVTADNHPPPPPGDLAERMSQSVIAKHLQIPLGTQVVQLRGEMTSLRRTPPLRGTEGHGGISGEVVVNPVQGHNLLLIRELPPVPPAHVYRLWANVGASPRPACTSCPTRTAAC